MALEDEHESYLVGKTDAFEVWLVVRDRSEPEKSSWTVEVTTRNLPGPGGSLAHATIAMPAVSAEELAPLLFAAGQMLSDLIEGDTNALPDQPPE